MVFGNKLGSPLLLHFVHSLEMHGSTLGQDELIQFQALNVIFLTKKMRDNWLYLKVAYNLAFCKWEEKNDACALSYS